MTPQKPCTLATPDGVRHYVVFLDAVYWRPPCGPKPYTKLKGWKVSYRESATCLTCISGLGKFIEHTAYYHEDESGFYWLDANGSFTRAGGT